MNYFVKSIYTKDLVGKEYRNCIGEFTYGKIKIIDYNEGIKLKIGRFCSIAKNTTIILGGEHRVDWVTTYPFPEHKQKWLGSAIVDGYPKIKGDVIIGNDVFIGFGVTILSGVTIGDGAIIGAMSLVTKNIEPYSIVGGNPAKIIRKRFSDIQIKKLLKIAWWNWSIKKIKNNINLLCSKNVKKVIEQYDIS